MSWIFLLISFFVSLYHQIDYMKKTTSELFVSYCYGSTDLDALYTTRKEAEKVNDEHNDTYEKYSNRFNSSEKNKRPYKVMTLYDAIELIKDHIKEQTEWDVNSRNDEESY